MAVDYKRFLAENVLSERKTVSLLFCPLSSNTDLNFSLSGYISAAQPSIESA
jgi:hypothetical protein